MRQPDLKERIVSYWNQNPCGNQWSKSERYSRQYYDELEESRYSRQPEIFSLAQFTRFYGKKVLEIGLGTGTDFIQWVRGGAEVHGIDITQKSVDHVRKRLDVYGLQAKSVEIADAENMPFSSDCFDLIYSFGVLHHTPDTKKALKEVVRCIKPGGAAKIMLYHRYSLNAFYIWMWTALRSGRPWRSLSSCIYNHLESFGTKAYTPKEVKAMLQIPGVSNLSIKKVISFYDFNNFFPPHWRVKYKYCAILSNKIGHFLSWVFGDNRVGWWLCIEFTKE